MGVVKQMNTNEKGICFAREVKFIRRFQGRPLVLGRVHWTSKGGTDPGEGKVGQGMNDIE